MSCIWDGFMLCIWHVLWPQMGGYCGQWKRAIFGMVSSQNGVYKSFQGALCHAIVWLGFEIAALALVFAQLCSPCIPSNLQL